MIRTEVLIVGGGPGGAACAWALRRHDVDCLVLDRVAFPRLKLCAGWIMPEVLTDLDFDAASYPYPLTTVPRLRLSVRGLKLQLPAKQLAIRRIEFDDWLLKRSGAPVQTHHVREIVRRDGGYVVDGEFFARYLIGAGGTNCPVARTLFEDVSPRSRDMLIVSQEEEFAYDWVPDGTGDASHLWFFENRLPGYAWYVPKAEGIVNVGVGGKAEKLKARGDTIQRHWALLVAELDRLGLVRDYAYSPTGHAYYLRQRQREVRKGNALIVGDAAGLATEDMGEGIAPAIKSGLLAANAIITGGDYTVDGIRRWSQPWPISWLLSKA